MYFSSELVAEAAPGRLAHPSVALTDPAGQTARCEVDERLEAAPELRLGGNR